jgi:S4 domain protein YaaA
LFQIGGVQLAEEINIQTPYITLGQLLKQANVTETGGQAKWYLRENTVLVNQEPDDRRGRKLYPGDIVAVPSGERFVINGMGATD